MKDTAHREAEVMKLLGPLHTRIRTKSNQGYLDRLKRARSWLIAASCCHDDRDLRFICCWIALNAMFGGFSTSKQSRAPLRRPTSALDFVDDEIWAFTRRVYDLDREGLIQKRLTPEIVRTGMDIIRDKWHFKPYWTAGSTSAVEDSLRRKAEDARSALQAKRYADYLAILLSRIQEIRNHVLHGASTYAVSKNRLSVEAAVTVLNAVVPTFAEIMEQPWSEAAVPWPPIERPRVGTPQNPDSAG